MEKFNPKIGISSIVLQDGVEFYITRITNGRAFKVNLRDKDLEETELVGKYELIGGGLLE